MFGTPRSDAPASDTTQQDATADGAATVSSRRSAERNGSAPSIEQAGVAAVVALGLLFSGAAGFVGGYLGSRADSDALTSANISQQKQFAASEGELISSIAQTVGPSVVSVNVVTRRPARKTSSVSRSRAAARLPERVRVSSSPPKASS